MLRIATALGRSGLQDWLIQRVSAVILGSYTLFLFAFWLSQSHISHFEWQNLFSLRSVQFFTLLAILSLIAHAWIGIWTVTTDYLKITWIRLSVQIITYICLLFYFIWGVQILWG